jgi:hypothetical protein
MDVLVGALIRSRPFTRKLPDSKIADVMTSRSSTLPYDADTMQKMIKLVKNAKSMSAFCDEEQISDFLAQMQKPVKRIISLGPVSTPVTHPSLITDCVSISARLMSFFGKPDSDMTTENSQLMHEFSTLEIPFLPRSETCTTYQGRDCV